MNEPRPDSYVLLAICIATAAVIATVLQSIQFITDFDPDTTSTLTIIGGAFSQISLALSMVCAVVMGRRLITNTPPWRAAALHTTATVDSDSDTTSNS